MLHTRVHIIQLILLPLLFVCSTICRGQSEGYQPKMLVHQHLNNDSILQAFEHRFAEMDSILSNSITTPSPTLQVNEGYEINTRLDSLFAAKEAQECKAFLRRSGLELTGQTYGRLDNIVSRAMPMDDDEDGSMSVYLAKIQAELGWNIFNSKFHHRKAHLQKIELENKLGLLKESRLNHTEIFEEINHTLTERYNLYIAIILYQRLRNIDLLNEAYQYMLEQDRVANDKILDIINDKMQIEYDMSQVCDATVIGDEPLYVIQPTVLSVDTVSLYASMEERNISIKQSLLQEDLLRNEKKLTTYSASMRLTPFARWSSYLTSHYGLSHNADLGVRFTFPLYNDAYRKRQSMDTQIDILQTTRSTFTNEKRAFCALRLARIHRLNQAIRTEFFHTSQLKKYLSLRNNAYSNSKNGYNFIIRMQEYNEYLKSLERQYKLMLQRSLLLLDIQKETGVLNLTGIVTEQAL